jgi:hypothetical protein
MVESYPADKKIALSDFELLETVGTGNLNLNQAPLVE